MTADPKRRRETDLAGGIRVASEAGRGGMGETTPSTPAKERRRAPSTSDRFTPEGDVRCDFVMDACICLKRKGHDGLHECAHGQWRASDGSA